MLFKDKIMNIVVAHSKLVTLGIALTITFVIGTVIGMTDHTQAISDNHQENFCYRSADCSQVNSGKQ
jgi:nitrate/TMAO reductase-like tetraheme cytochrome c subunit